MVAATLSSPSSLSLHLLHQLRRQPLPSPLAPPPSLLLSLSLNSRFAPASATAKSNALSLPPSPLNSVVRFHALIFIPPSFSSIPSRLTSSRLLSSSSSSVAVFTQTPSLDPETSTNTEIFGEGGGHDGDEGSGLLLEEEEKEEEMLELARWQPRTAGKVPDLSVKEKKELASYAHSLGKKLKSQLVGKSRVTDNVVASFIEMLDVTSSISVPGKWLWFKSGGFSNQN